MVAQDTHTKPKVDLNRAGREELATVEGIGQQRADLIIRYREKNGPFGSIEDLDNVPGFAEKMVEVVSRNVTVGRGSSGRRQGGSKSGRG
jgi:competence protein ComEA